tara:strand:- start:15134 stop:15784 length:651 start_codon:yes stop_codon:yes gene_type:complete
MDASLLANWSQSVSTHFTAVEIVLPSQTIRLVSGGFVSFDVDGSPVSFTARDTVYGTLGEVAVIKDGIDAVALSATIKLLPPTDTAMAGIAAPAAQGSLVRIWQGAVDQATGLADGAPELLFTGELDFGTLSVSARSWVVALECLTEEARQLEPDAQRRLSDAFHQKVWPGELGLSHVTNLSRKIYWRLAEPRGAATGGGGEDRGGSNPGTRRRLN